MGMIRWGAWITGISISLSRCSQIIAERKRSLETVDLDSSFGDTFLDKEVGDLQTLITLELDNLPSLFVVNESTVACEFLLSRRQTKGSAYSAI